QKKMPSAPGTIRRAWYQWKMRRFPWRRKWLVGFDLQGNTFWEFKDALHALRNRRIAQYSRSTHYGDINVSPSWMQWLRHTRFEPPTLAEQQQDLARQDRIKVLASQADARWASKPSALDAPDKGQPVQMLQSRDLDSSAGQMNMDINQEIRDAPSAETLKKEKNEPIHSPWKQADSSKDWQPRGWAPAPVRSKA
ncbi:hypothetical protein GQ44DRAFT_632471, partial [Phaeosphaeriaceae sp. PMI808]